MRKLINWKSLIVVFIIGFGFTLFHFYNKYSTTNPMYIKITELTPQAYPDNPATKNKNYGLYSYKQLVLDQSDNTHFSFTFVPANSDTATIIFKNIDVSLMTPGIPKWIENDPNLVRIALTDRQWNRQQVYFEPKNIEISGGDGFAKKHTYTLELAKNCLNAGLWEVLLYSYENGHKSLYYQGWFNFPLGYYQQLLTQNTGLHYYKVWYYLEHWFNPAGKVIELSKLRKVVNQATVPVIFNRQESITARGEQINKAKNVIAADIKTYNDYYTQPVSFSTFTPPGIYVRNKPWKNEYWRIANIKSAVIRSIISPARPNKILQELELIYLDKDGNHNSFYISGFELSQLIRTDINHYDQGRLYLMGIGTPPLEQSYIDLYNNPPDKSPEFSVFLAQDNAWINHHEMAIDGSILFADKNNPNILHVCMVSYERHAIVAHYTLDVSDFIRLGK